MLVGFGAQDFGENSYSTNLPGILMGAEQSVGFSAGVQNSLSSTAKLLPPKKVKLL